MTIGGGYRCRFCMLVSRLSAESVLNSAIVGCSVDYARPSHFVYGQFPYLVGWALRTSSPVTQVLNIPRHEKSQ